MDRLKHILSSRQFDLGFLINIYKDAVQIRDLLKTMEGKELLTHVLPGYVIGEIFWQESSRTYHSFASAAHRLGAHVVAERGVKRTETKNGEEVTRWVLPFSSEMKDAWLEDEAKAWASFYDLLILRTPPDIEIDYLKAVLEDGGYDVPLVNAGDGPREHPTQTLLDTFSIFHGLGLDPERDWAKLKNYTVLFINDNKNARVIHSLAPTLAKFNMKLGFASTTGFEIPDYLREELRIAGCDFTETKELVPADVYYVTRHQSEYGMSDERGFVVNKSVADKYGVKVILHPFPRSKVGGELPIYLIDKPETLNESLDKDKRAFYFYQMMVGVPVRMALLKYLLNPHLDFIKLKEKKLIRGLKSQCASCQRIEYEDLGWTERAPKEGYLQGLPHVFCEACRPQPALK